MQSDPRGVHQWRRKRQCHAQKKRRIQDDITRSTPPRRSDCWKPPGVTAMRFRTSSTASTRPERTQSRICSRTGCTAWPSGSGRSDRENRPTYAWRSDGVRATSPVKAARLQAATLKDSNADALPLLLSPANIDRECRDIRTGAEMPPRIPENIRSLVTIMGGNRIPPRDPNDDDDEDDDDEEDEDRDEEPAVVREPDE